ncbi:2'-5' RNA ligase [Dactylosporangium vinaceum]|uniref:T4 RnlA family RNA ligase n=1 Tax=Dactylosporangium vinaceum TaxID=53362 RepID=A0ABV5M6M6_9ACTN|nr:T4 RnlA family RNA ligase [Dactylosporangium vinaceum]UAB97906.1 2'-5' RNA ligase [Dactylosporangium vinaceum]
MSLHIDELCDPKLLADMVTGGYIRTQTHPSLPLLIHNYTEKTQYEGVWNAATLACRGLVVSAEGRVLARPFAKFFNHGQPGAPDLDLDGPVTVTDKADGSLGILFPTPDGWAVATRGSFDSDQARHATKVFRSRYAHRFEPPAGLTPLFEIIYPENRIVLDYGDLDDLVLLGAVDIATGRSHGPSAVPGWPGPVVETFAYATLAEALAAPPRDNREGLVVHFTASDARLKIKYSEYVRLHRIVTGLNARVVWEALLAGRLDELLEPLPDEFHAWATGIAAQLGAEVEGLAAAVEREYAGVVAALPAGWTRKDFALAVAGSPRRGCLFLRLDDKDYTPLLWQQVRPAVSTPRDDEEAA